MLNCQDKIILILIIICELSYNFFQNYVIFEKINGLYFFFMNELQNQDQNDIRYFWRKSDYKYDTIMKNIKAMALKDGLSSEEFDMIKGHFESQNKINIHDDNQIPLEKIDDIISSFLLELNKEEFPIQYSPAPFFEHKTISAELNIKNYSHKNIDLHGFTKNGARQVVRRVLLNLDRKKKNTIKFNVGKGKHSFDNKQALPNIVYEVCKNLGFHQPSVSTKNQGYLQITIDPIINDE